VSTFVVYEEAVRVPDWAQKSLKKFRQWFHSDDFPESGRICYLNGEVWVDMSKEQLFTHNQVKQEYNVVVGGLVKMGRLGRYFPDGALLTNVDANLSVQPDGLYASYDSIETEKVRLIEGTERGYLELAGTPEMVLEIVSTSSVGKDTEILMDLYWQAGIPEYWLVDVRGERLLFEIYRYTAKGYFATRKREGWIKSKVFGKSFRLTRQPDKLGNPEYTLEVR
jgi:hypothetical protein